jgi:phosphohistidine phosphatase
MLLYVIRHATAADPAEHATDEERPLTSEGRKEVKLLAATLPKHGVRPTVILSSPLVRAWETAEGLVPALKPRPALEECLVLAPGGKARELAAVLAEQTGDVAIVGHNPDLEEHLAWLIGSRKAQVELAKGAVACLRCEGPFEKGCATLVWLITPEFC